MLSQIKITLNIYDVNSVQNVSMILPCIFIFNNAESRPKPQI